MLTITYIVGAWSHYIHTYKDTPQVKDKNYFPNGESTVSVFSRMLTTVLGCLLWGAVCVKILIC